MSKTTKGYIAGAFAALALAGCGGSGGGLDESPQPNQPPAGNTGYLNLSVSDAPIKDATKVCIRFDGVELKHADSDDREVIDFDEPEVVNLLAHQGANSKPILTGAEVPAGTYEWIRLKVQAERGMMGGSNDPGMAGDLCDEDTENSYLVRSEMFVHNLYVPSGSQRGLQLIKDITIPVNSSGDYTAEWDLGKSFNAPPGQAPDVMMKPVVKLVSNNEVGTLVGQVAEVFIEAESCADDFAPSVYVFDDGITPNPIDDPIADDDAVATGLVQYDDDQMQWRYSIGFLLAGSYEAAFTCNGTDFIPVAGKTADIFVGEVTTVDFLAEDAPGSLAGQVGDEYFNPAEPEYEACNQDVTAIVAVFPGDVVPNFDDEPIATGEVVGDFSAGEPHLYSIDPLDVGSYNAAFSCDGATFIPAEGKPAEIFPGEETIVNFFVEPTA